MPRFVNQQFGDASFISFETLANPPQQLIDNMSGVYITPDNVRYVSDGVSSLIAQGSADAQSGTFTNDVSSAIAVARTLQEKGSDVWSVKDFGVVGDANDPARMQAAIDALYALGLRGTLVYPWNDGGYVCGRPVPALQLGITFKPGIGVDFGNNVFTLNENAEFFSFAGIINSSAIITGDTSAASPVIPCADTSNLAVGASVMVKIGTAAYDIFEPDCTIRAKIVSINPNVSVTIDRPVGYDSNIATGGAGASGGIPGQVAGTGGAAVATNLRSILNVEFYSNISIKGNPILVNPMIGAANAECGFNIRYAENVDFETVEGRDVGAGLVLLQFCYNVRGKTLLVPTCAQQGGQASKGRVAGFAESYNCSIETVRARDCYGTPIVIEGNCINCGIDKLFYENTIEDNSTYVIGLLGNGDFYVKNVYLDGFGMSLWGGSQDFGYPMFENIFLSYSVLMTPGLTANYFIPPTVNGLIRFANQGRYRLIERSVTYYIKPNANTSFSMPRGVYVGMSIYARITATFGVSTFAAINNAAGVGISNDLLAVAVAGIPTAIPNSVYNVGQGSNAYGAVDTTASPETRTINFFAGADLPENTTVTFLFKMLEPVSVSTLSYFDSTIDNEYNAKLFSGGVDNIIQDSSGVLRTNANWNIDGRTSKIGVGTLAALGSAAIAGSGTRAFINDALTPVFGSTAVGGGSVNAPVYSDGVNWIVG